MEGFQDQITKLLRTYENMEQSMVGKQIEIILTGIQHVMRSRASKEGSMAAAATYAKLRGYEAGISRLQASNGMSESAT
jgi:hypothetical protein